MATRPVLAIWMIVAALLALIVPSQATARVGATASAAAICDPTPLGAATPFNLFAFRTLTQRNTGTEGRIAVGGRATLSDHSLGVALDPADTSDSLVVGGALEYARARVAAGNIVVGESATVTDVTMVPGNGYRQGSTLDFAAAESELLARAVALAALPTNGTATVTLGEITLVGTAVDLNVFAISGAALTAARSLTITVPAGATALVNVSGASSGLRNFGFTPRGVDRTRVLLNFPTATTLALESVGVEGSILAPQAVVTFDQGGIKGQLIAASISGTGQAVQAPFAGCLPAASTVAPCQPGPEALFVADAAGVGGSVVRTKQEALLTVDVASPAGTTLYLQVTDATGRIALSAVRAVPTAAGVATRVLLARDVPFTDTPSATGEYRVRVSTAAAFAPGVSPRECTVLVPFAVRASAVPRSTFPDVSATNPYREAIGQLAARGVIRGYADGTFGPADQIVRAQMAALIARAMGWDADNWGTRFPDRGVVDADLWRNVGALEHYGVARGYADGTYDPTGQVLNAQAISFITRALVAKGVWQQQADDLALYPNVPANSGHRQDLATYFHYASAVPGTNPVAVWSEWNQPATRGWFAQALWQAFAVSTAR